MKNFFLQTVILIVFTLTGINQLFSKDLNPYKKGENLFQTNCSPCHAVGKELIGPALVDVTKKRPRAWLQRFIQNSQQVIQGNDEYAQTLFKNYNHAIMPSFQKTLSVPDINNILDYLEQESYLPQRIFSEEEIDIHGKDLFDRHCKTCHFIDQEQYGPGLASVAKRRPTEWLHRFIKNSTKVIQSGDPYAIHLHDAFNDKKMPSFEFLSDEEIHSILYFIEEASTSPTHRAGVNSQNNLKRFTVYNKSTKVSENKVIAPYAHGEWIFKILLGMATLIAASFHTYVMYRLLRYLLRK